MNKQWVQPCPYCKSEKPYCGPLSAELCRVLCIECFMAGPAHKIEEEAIKLWNKIEIHNK